MDHRIAEATTAAGKVDAVIAAAQAAKEKVPALEKAAAERTALAEKAAAEKLEADRRIAATNATIEQANATIAAAQAAKDKAAAAEKAAADAQKEATQPAPVRTPSPSSQSEPRVDALCREALRSSRFPDADKALEQFVATQRDPAMRSMLADVIGPELAERATGNVPGQCDAFTALLDWYPGASVIRSD